LLRKTRWSRILLSLLLLLLATIVLSMVVGTAPIPMNDILNIFLSRIPGLEALISSTYLPSWEIIIIEVRLPRVLLGAFVGASLAVAGTSMQGLFRNPMADPFVIGISSGAALGAVMTLPMESVLLDTGVHYVAPFFAFVGALGAVLLVYSISRVGGKLPVETLLLAGVAVASFLSAVTSIVKYAYSRDIWSVLFGLTGSLGAAEWIDINVVFPACVLGTVILVFFARDLNGIMLGEETAKHLGIEAEKVKKIILVVSSFITAAAVVTSGTIGFVGLVTPHVMRLIVGPDHRILIPSSAIVGGIFLIWCDTIARTLIAVPVSMITALFGAPFFIYLLWRRKRST